MSYLYASASFSIRIIIARFYSLIYIGAHYDEEATEYYELIDVFFLMH